MWKLGVFFSESVGWSGQGGEIRAIYFEPAMRSILEELFDDAAYRLRGFFRRKIGYHINNDKYQ